MTQKIASAGLVIALSVVLGVSPALASTSTMDVTTDNMQGWVFYNDQIGGPGTGVLAQGPGTPPIGSGSAQFTLTGPSDGQIIALGSYGGTQLSDLTTISYSTYQSATNPSNATAIALQFNVDKDVTDTNTAWQGRLVYEPYQNNGGTVPLGSWNTWNALSGKWWLSKSATSFGGNCSQAAPCTLAELETLYPNMGVHATMPGVVLKAGSGWTSFTGAVDALTIGVSGTSVTYNFDVPPPPPPPVTTPSNKEACKNGGWMSFSNPTFKNQGQCVAYTNQN